MRRPPPRKPRGAKPDGRSCATWVGREARRSRRRTPPTIRSRRCSCARFARRGHAVSPDCSRRATCCARCSRCGAPHCWTTRSKRELEWVEDPTNLARRFLRNRIRHDILPALRSVSPGIDRELLEIGERAATWRRETETIAQRRIHGGPRRESGGRRRGNDRRAGFRGARRSVARGGGESRSDPRSPWDRPTRGVLADVARGIADSTLRRLGGRAVASCASALRVPARERG